MKKILFCIPWYIEFDSVKLSLTRLKKYFITNRELVIDDTHITIIDGHSPYVGMSRDIFITGSNEIKIKNNLAIPSEIKNYDNWLFCDSDIEFGERELKRIIELDKDIVSLPYQMNSKKISYCVRTDGVAFPLNTTGLKKVDGCGAGFLKVKRDVFVKMPPYWFFIEQKTKDDVLRFVPEDFNFCEKARKLGYDVWVDFDYPVKHNNKNLI